jgi:hypothetical protein
MNFYPCTLKEGVRRWAKGKRQKAKGKRQKANNLMPNFKSEKIICPDLKCNNGFLGDKREVKEIPLRGPIFILYKRNVIRKLRDRISLYSLAKSRIKIQPHTQREKRGP